MPPPLKSGNLTGDKQEKKGFACVYVCVHQNKTVSISAPPCVCHWTQIRYIHVLAACVQAHTHLQQKCLIRKKVSQRPK